MINILTTKHRRSSLEVFTELRPEKRTLNYGMKKIENKGKWKKV